MKKVFKKFFSMLVVCCISFGLMTSTKVEAAIKILVSPVRNSAVETGKVTDTTIDKIEQVPATSENETKKTDDASKDKTNTDNNTSTENQAAPVPAKPADNQVLIGNIASILKSEIVDAINASEKFSYVTDSADYTLICNITEIELYKSKSDKQKVLTLLRKTLGKDANGEDDKSITEEDKNKASAELKEITNNPFAAKILADVKAVDKGKGKTILSKNIVGNKTGTAVDYAVKSACKDLAESIISELSGSETSAPDKTSSAEDEFAEIDVVDVPITPAPKTETPKTEVKTADDFKAEIFDTLPENNTFYIKAGSSTNLKVGEVLKIYRLSGDVVMDGEVVGKKEIEIGNAVVTEIFEKYAVCKITRKTEDIKVDDIVKRR